jgi:hypothetical protein
LYIYCWRRYYLLQQHYKYYMLDKSLKLYSIEVVLSDRQRRNVFPAMPVHRPAPQIIPMSRGISRSFSISSHWCYLASNYHRWYLAMYYASAQDVIFVPKCPDGHTRTFWPGFSQLCPICFSWILNKKNVIKNCHLSYDI